jgi:hypothetical protein
LEQAGPRVIAVDLPGMGDDHSVTVGDVTLGL